VTLLTLVLHSPLRCGLGNFHTKCILVYPVPLKSSNKVVIHPPVFEKTPTMFSNKIDPFYCTYYCINCILVEVLLKTPQLCTILKSCPDAPNRFQKLRIISACITHSRQTFCNSLHAAGCKRVQCKNTRFIFPATLRHSLVLFDCWENETKKTSYFLREHLIV
jgi:hypothetical protein